MGHADNRRRNNVSPVRTLALEHAVAECNFLLKCEEFCDVLLEEGEFGVHFAKMLTKQLF